MGGGGSHFSALLQRKLDNSDGAHGKTPAGEAEHTDHTFKLSEQNNCPSNTSKMGSVFLWRVQPAPGAQAPPVVTDLHGKSSFKEKFALTRILLIAATISTRLLGRATSRLPMYCSQGTGQVERVKRAAFASPLCARLSHAASIFRSLLKSKAQQMSEGAF